MIKKIVVGLILFFLFLVSSGLVLFWFLRLANQKTGENVRAEYKCWSNLEVTKESEVNLLDNVRLGSREEKDDAPTGLLEKIKQFTKTVEKAQIVLNEEELLFLMKQGNRLPGMVEDACVDVGSGKAVVVLNVEFFPSSWWVRVDLEEVGEEPYLSAENISLGGIGLPGVIASPLLARIDAGLNGAYTKTKNTFGLTLRSIDSVSLNKGEVVVEGTLNIPGR